MRSFSAEGIVLKRVNIGETDRIVTVFTRERGKFASLAKGVRRITSSRSSALEPGVHAKLFFAKGHNLPILTQAQCICAFSGAKNTLVSTRSLSQVLEIVDAVTVESDEYAAMFDRVLEILYALHAHTSERAKILKILRAMLADLGFADMKGTAFASINDYVEFLSNRKMKSFAYLTVKQQA